jgi:hypothetical protein
LLVALKGGGGIRRYTDEAAQLLKQKLLQAQQHVQKAG